MQYKPFRKNLYVEVPDIKLMSEQEVSMSGEERRQRKRYRYRDTERGEREEKLGDSDKAGMRERNCTCFNND